MTLHLLDWQLESSILLLPDNLGVHLVHYNVIVLIEAGNLYHLGRQLAYTILLQPYNLEEQYHHFYKINQDCTVTLYLLDWQLESSISLLLDNFGVHLFLHNTKVLNDAVLLDTPFQLLLYTTLLQLDNLEAHLVLHRT